MTDYAPQRPTSASVNEAIAASTWQKMDKLGRKQCGPLLKIVSGGQTGVDRGGLDAAIALGLEHGGWCPRGRLAEDGTIPERYQLNELSSSDYTVRTERNVIDSDGTLILYRVRMSGGTSLTNRLAKSHGKPLLRVRLDQPIRYLDICRWIVDEHIEVLNVAGPRGSSHPQLQVQTSQLLCRVADYLTQSLPLN